ncbi:MAG: hypothetical protein GC137_07305 [Alphaproteobacteria bacterium]|nr:hypothetical protein [Alphaproteobacteria bacterium]
MAYIVISRTNIDDLKYLNQPHPPRVMFQSLTASGKNSVADPDNGFDEKVSYAETRAWHENPQDVSFIGSMGRRAGDDRFSETALKSEGIKPAEYHDAYMVEVDGTAFTIEDDTPLSVYAGVEFDPAFEAIVSFDNTTDLEKAIHELTGGKPAWVRIRTPHDEEARVDYQTRSVPGFDQTIPLSELGGKQTVFAQEHDVSDQTFEGYYAPRGAYDPADGIYYGLKEESPGFLHVHTLPDDIGHLGQLERYNAHIWDTTEEGEAISSIGGHALSISNGKNVVVEIMSLDAALVKVGMNGNKTVMRPLVQKRDLDAEESFRQAVVAEVEAAGFALTDVQLTEIWNQDVLDRDAALKVSAGKVLEGIPATMKVELLKRVDVMEPRDIRQEDLPRFGL